MQLLGHVGTGVVDDDPLGGLGQRDAQPRVGELAGRLAADPLVAQREVNEARPADLDLGDRAGLGLAGRAGEARGDGGGDLARRAAQRLGQRQRRVGLVVSELRRPDDRVRSGVLPAALSRQRVRTSCASVSSGSVTTSAYRPGTAGPLDKDGRRRKWLLRGGPNRCRIFSVMPALDRSAASRMAAAAPGRRRHRAR